MRFPPDCLLPFPQLDTIAAPVQENQKAEERAPARKLAQKLQRQLLAANAAAATAKACAASAEDRVASAEASRAESKEQVSKCTKHLSSINPQRAGQCERRRHTVASATQQRARVGH